MPMKQCIYRSGGKSLLTAESPKNPQKKNIEHQI